MDKLKYLTGLMIAHGNETAMSALRSAGVPLATAQKLLLSKEWQKAQKEAVQKKIDKERILR